jgi:hypothetical protein
MFVACGGRLPSWQASEIVNLEIIAFMKCVHEWSVKCKFILSGYANRPVVCTEIRKVLNSLCYNKSCWYTNIIL